MRNILIIGSFLLLFLTSCFKKEIPIQLPYGESQIQSFYLGANYENQIFFDLSSNSFQTRGLIDWDLRFESSDKGIGVFINNGYDIKIRKTNLYNLDEPLTLDTNYIKTLPDLIDAPEGNFESSAIGDWRNYVLTTSNKSGIYILELIYNKGWDRYMRMQILSVNDSGYMCKFSPLSYNGSLVKEWPDITFIPKDKTQNFTYFTFKNGGRVVDNAEPNKNTWDLEFTKYKHIFYNYGPNPFPYLVTGVLSNSNQVEVAMDTTTNYDNINANDLSKYQFTKNRNGIGFEWKSFDFSSSFVFSVNNKNTYIIKDTDGKHYKLRFLDFYNEQRVKGYPKFEFILIK
ncbi:MAG: HmuY family protein [Bacteroidota bacterium]|nr:HmuY family protein [Bacteroidota bacterium]